MALSVKGKIEQILKPESGVSRAGKEWNKQEFVIETEDQYPKKVCVSIWGDKIDQFGLKVGEQVTLGIDVESREYNGRWYTDVKAWKVSRDGSSADVSYPATSQDDGYGSFEGSDTLDNDVIPF